MKFLRHLLVVSAVVALVVALGFVWSHSGAADLVADGGGDRRQVSDTAGSRAPRDDGRFERRGAGGISLSHADDLVQTVFIEAAILGGVVAIDITRRHRRRRIPAA